MFRSAWLILPLIALAAGCGPKPATRSQALLVSVSFEPGALSQCVRVIATPKSGTAGETSPISKKDTLSIAVFRAPDWSEQVTLVARGYESCADSDFIESSDSVTRSFPAEGAEGVTLVVKKQPVVVTDLDGDGKSGADDCDDNDPLRFVGNAEACNSAKDNNCSLSTGCDDPACTGACSPAGLGTCQAGVCTGSNELSCVDQFDNDNDALIDCMDPDCTSQSCSDGTACTTGDVCVAGGLCTGTPITVSCGTAPGSCFLAPGTCNPFDGGCVFAMKDAGTVCNDGNACTQSERCTPNGECGGPTMTTKSCNTPPNTQCYAAAGVCNTVDAGCSYTATTGACDDGQLCTENDACSNGTCSGAAKVCFQSSDPCKLDAGSCDPADGQCDYGNAPNTNLCNDNDACTQLDRCTNGACVGQNPVTCTASDVCHTAGSCNMGTGICSNPMVTCSPRSECETAGPCVVSSGGCTYAAANEGAACNNNTGTCQSGACIGAFVPFDSSPPASNFAPDAGRMPTEGLNITCAATLETSGPSNTATFNACGRTLSSADGGIEFIAQGPNQAALIRATSLFVADGGSITITGTRPVIFAIYGHADIRGVIDASASGANSGPGANLSCNAPLPGDKNTNGGGSGGGGGAFGATGGKGGVGEGTTSGSTAGTASSNDAIIPFRGGCSGATGGSNGTAPTGGGGGGGLQLSVAGSLRLSGTLVANGGAGQGGAQFGGEGEGAGGGGSGGAILIEADSVTLKSTAKIFANGGSGGEGGDSGQSTRGASGNDGIRAYGQTPGSSNLGSGTEGGAGGGGATPSGANVTTTPSTDDGGGGGGGSMGRIRINYGSGCRENGYVISPSNATTTSTPAISTGFTTNTGSIFGIGNGGSCP